MPILSRYCTKSLKKGREGIGLKFVYSICCFVRRVKNFVKVMPTEYKLALKRLETEEQMVEELTA